MTTTITLKAESAAGEQFIFDVKNGQQYKVISSSEDLLYQITNTNLVIYAKPGTNGETVTLTKGNNTIIYQVQIPEFDDNVEVGVSYYLGQSETVPANVSDLHNKQNTNLPKVITFDISDSKCTYLAIKGCDIDYWKNDFNGIDILSEFDSNNSFGFNKKTIGDYTVYYYYNPDADSVGTYSVKLV